MEEKLLRAKLSLIKMVHQFMYTVTIDGELYYDDYCESAGESAFSVLEIEDDRIKAEDFCKLHEKIERELWTIMLPNEAYGGFEVIYGKGIYY